MQINEDTETLDFQAELMMLLSQDSNMDDNLCLISNSPLEENHVKLCCNHKFNYASIYNEILNQKKTYNHLETQKLCTHEIKCPYCRTVQKGLLPSREGFNRIVGVNWPKKYQYKANICKYVFVSGIKKGKTCGKKCFNKYCDSHEKIILKRENKKLLKEKKKLEKEQEKLLKQLKKTEQNIKIKAKINQKVDELSPSTINIIVSTPDKSITPHASNSTELAKVQMEQIMSITKPPVVTCVYKFKRGKNKGKNCQCKKIYNNGLCKLHYNQYLKKIENESAKETKMKILLTAVNPKGPKIKNVSIHGKNTIITV